MSGSLDSADAEMIAKRFEEAASRITALKAEVADANAALKRTIIEFAEFRVRHKEIIDTATEQIETVLRDATTAYARGFNDARDAAHKKLISARDHSNKEYSEAFDRESQQSHLAQAYTLNFIATAIAALKPKE